MKKEFNNQQETLLDTVTIEHKEGFSIITTTNASTGEKSEIQAHLCEPSPKKFRSIRNLHRKQKELDWNFQFTATSIE